MFNPQPKPEKPILLTGSAKTAFRVKIGTEAHGICQTCGCYAPIYIGSGTHFNVFLCGHVSHIRPRKIGGDTPNNVRWECHNCHIGVKHGPRWSVNKKLMDELSR